MIVYGTVCLDRFVLTGQSDGDATEFPGGEAFNTATALAGWGVPVTLTGTAIGDDAEGLRLRELLRTHPLASGIDLSLVPLVFGAGTPVCTVRVDETGERFMSGRGFQEVTAPKLETILSRFADRPLFTVDPNLGENAIEATLAAADAGCAVVSMDCAHLPDVLAASEIAVTSSEWVSRLSLGSTPAALRHMVSGGAKLAVVTEGVKGGECLRSGEVQSWRFPAAVPPSPILDTTGAGDTFRAMLCYCLNLRLTYGQERSDFSDTTFVRFASAAAALHCTILGGGSRFPVETVNGLASRVGVRQL